MVVIDKENYEMIFFDILEGEYSVQEEMDLLEQISNDAFLSEEWASWQKSKIAAVDFPLLSDDTQLDRMKYNVDQAIQEEDKKVVPIFYYISGIAAGILLLFVFFFSFRNNEVEHNERGVVTVETTSVVEGDSLTLESQNAPETKDQIVERKVEKKKSIQRQIIAVPEESVPLIANEPELKEQTPKDEGDETLDVEDPKEELIAQIPFEQVDTHTNQRNLKFSVTTEDVVREVTVFEYSYLEKNNINLQQLIADRRITLVRYNNSLCIKLLEGNRPPLLIALK